MRETRGVAQTQTISMPSPILFLAFVGSSIGNNFIPDQVAIGSPSCRSHFSSGLASPALFSSLLPRNMVHIEKRIADDLGLTLPPASPAAANYRPCQRSGDLLFLSGHLPLGNDGNLQYTGKIGDPTQSVEFGYNAARQVGLNLLATMSQELGGDLDRVVQIVKLFGIVQATDTFHEQHKVMNGCSDLMVQVFGPERGAHSRSAIGTNALPLNTVIEIEAIVQIKPLDPK